MSFSGVLPNATPYDRYDDVRSSILSLALSLLHRAYTKQKSTLVIVLTRDAEAVLFLRKL